MKDAKIIQPNTWAALWRSITRIDRSKVNHVPIAIRNSVAVAVPLAVGIAIGNALGGVAVATGALNVSYSDGTDPYAHRARRMLAWSVIGAIAVFTGSITAPYHWLSTIITMAWAFVAGMQLAVSPRAGDLGLNTLVALIVFSARGPNDLRGILYGTLLVLGGGLLQTAMALLFWPVSRHVPERRALSAVYSELAKSIAAPSSTLLSAPLSSPAQDVQDTLDALGRDFTIEGERFRYLFDQVDRIQLSAFSLKNLSKPTMERESKPATPGDQVQQVFSIASELTLAVSEELLTSKTQAGVEQRSQALQELVNAIHEESQSGDSQARDISAAVDVFAGQVRAVARMASRATPESEEGKRLLDALGPKEQLKQWLGVLRANLSFESATCRHAIRMAACVALADGISRAVSWHRSYWIPMTVAVILKPDFTTTLSRGFLRLLGTLGGLVLATGLFHWLPNSALAELLLVGVFTFVMRMFGPANYGIFSVAISGLIVFLIAETGVPPAEVVKLRGTNTLAGGVIALLAYLVWPTWERKRIGDTFAELIDATRAYFQGVIKRFLANEGEQIVAFEKVQQDWRRARSNAEGSMDRVSSEPNFSAVRLTLLTSMLASSHALAEAVREMEAETLQVRPQRSSPALQAFANDVEFTLYYLAASLRGSKAATQTLPKLREDHRRLVQTKDSLGTAQGPVLLGTDRITTTLNTLREQAMQYLGQTANIDDLPLDE